MRRVLIKAEVTARGDNPLLHAAAFVLLNVVRGVPGEDGAGTRAECAAALQAAQAGVLVRETCRKVWLQFASSCPVQHLWRCCWSDCGRSGPAVTGVAPSQAGLRLDLEVRALNVPESGSNRPDQHAQKVRREPNARTASISNTPDRRNACRSPVMNNAG